MEHKLMIRSLHDAIAECKCKGWHYTFTGKSTVGEIMDEWLKHVEQYEKGSSTAGIPLPEPN